MLLLYQLLIVAVSLGGFLVALYIHHHKRHARPMVCPLQSDCEAVVHSDYSVLFGWPLENLGMVYYAAVAFGYAIFVIYPEIPSGIFSQALAIASVAAFLLSIYLTYIQAVKLKEWCTWCLFSALCSTIIFLAALGLWVVY